MINWFKRPQRTSRGSAPLLFLSFHWWSHSRHLGSLQSSLFDLILPSVKFRFPLLLLLLPSVFPALLPFFPLLSLPAATQRSAFPPHRLDPPAVIRKSRLQSDSNTRAAVTFLLSWTTVPVFTSRAGSFNVKQLYLSLISAGWQWAETLMNF